MVSVERCNKSAKYCVLWDSNTVFTLGRAICCCDNSAVNKGYFWPAVQAWVLQRVRTACDYITITFLFPIRSSKNTCISLTNTVWLPKLNACLNNPNYYSLLNATYRLHLTVCSQQAVRVLEHSDPFSFHFLLMTYFSFCFSILEDLDCIQMEGSINLKHLFALGRTRIPFLRLGICVCFLKRVH